MSRHLTTAGQLLLIAATLAVAAYVLVASVQTPDHPAVSAGQLAAAVALSFAAFVLLLALVFGGQLAAPRILQWWRVKRALRRRVRHRARRFGGRR